MRKALLDSVVVCAGMLFIGALWQLEIADIALINHYEYRYVFNQVAIANDWMVRDVWMLVMMVCFISVSVLALRGVRFD